MKKFFLLTTILLLFCVSNIIKASQVDEVTAKRVALNFYYERINMKQNVPFSNLTVEKTISVYNQSGKIVYYVFNFKNYGYIIISAEDVALPVLVYNFNTPYEAENQPVEFVEWMEMYKAEITTAAQSKATGDPETIAIWNKYNVPSEKFKLDKGVQDAGPLCTTIWRQLKYYNDQCPKSSSTAYYLNGKSPTGCVATAMAQIMKYHNYPAKGTGSRNGVSFNTTYDWAKMSNILDDWSTPNVVNMAPGVTQTNVDAVAKLMYHCGRAINTIYSATFGAADPNDAIAALKTYFGYNSAARFIMKSSYTSTWDNILQSNLNAKRPILYRGSDASGNNGHSFVCDGFQSGTTVNYHFNMGWGPTYVGYYTLSALNFSSQGYDLRYNQGAGVDIYPLTTDIENTSTHINAVEIYPNPANQQLNIALNIPLNSTKATITDISGKIVFASEFNSKAEESEISIDISSFSKGMYFISIVNNDAFINKKIIIE